MPVCDYPGISSDFPLADKHHTPTSSEEHIKPQITGNFLDRLTDGLKKEAPVLGILTLIALTKELYFSLVFRGNISGQHESYLGYVDRRRFLEPGVEVGALGFNHPHR